MLSKLSYPFWSKSDRRLRTLWRVLIHAGLWIVMSLAIIFPTALLIGFVSGTLSQSQEGWFLPLGSIVQVFSMLIALYLMARFIDRRQSITQYGLDLNRKWWLDLSFGLALGVLLQSGIFVVQYLLGWVTITDTFFVAGDLSFGVAFSYAIALFLGVGIYEEMLSRGYHMRNIAEGMRFLSPRTALIIAWVFSSIVFGVLHATNPNATLISTVNIALAGLLLGLPVLLTGRLGAAIGLHITWNFTMNSIFGFPVSGLDTTVSILAIEQAGPDLWTGGAFGPEAGIIGLLAIAIGMGLTVLWVRFLDGQLGLHTDYTQYHPRKPKNDQDEETPLP